MPFSIKVGPTFVPVGLNRVWLRQGGAWVPVIRMGKREGDGVGPWNVFYDTTVLVAPTGSVGISVGAGGTATLTVTNRSSVWRLTGTVSVNGGAATSFDVAADSTAVALGGVTPGTVTFVARYFNTISSELGPTTTFTRNYTLPT